MERFGETFRGGITQLSTVGLQCPEIGKELKISGCLEDIYKDDIPIETIRTIAKISDIRKSRQE